MPIGDLLAQITGEPSPTQPTAPLPPKRKPDGELHKPVDKLQKTGQTSANSSRPVTQANRSAVVNSKMANMKLGSSRPSLPSPSTTFKNGQPTPPPSTETVTSKPAKKGSFAEIMARGQAQQARLGQIGKIQHKKIEKPPSKREREEMQAQKARNLQKNLSPGGKFRSAGQSAIANARNGERERPAVKKNVPEPQKKAKKAAVATTGYTGTARPKPGSASSRPPVSSSSRYGSPPSRYRDDNRGSSSKKYRYQSEDEEEEEDEADYGSDASSDMEAAAYEVDEEEEEAARIARREDAEALAEENRLKREKEEKRRRLAAMAAKNRR